RRTSTTCVASGCATARSCTSRSWRAGRTGRSPAHSAARRKRCGRARRVRSGVCAPTCDRREPMPDVRELLEQLADDGTPRGAAAVLHDARRAAEPGAPPPTRRHHTLAVGSIGIALLAVIVGFVALLARDDEPVRAIASNAPATNAPGVTDPTAV